MESETLSARSVWWMRSGQVESAYISKDHNDIVDLGSMIEACDADPKFIRFTHHLLPLFLPLSWLITGHPRNDYTVVENSPLSSPKSNSHSGGK